jgi:hypothetical protein
LALTPLYGVRDESVVTVDLTASRSLGDHELSRGLLKVQGWVQAVPADEARETTVAIAERCPDEALFEALEPLKTTAGPRLLRVDVGRVIYLTGPESGVLDAEEYLDATPDHRCPVPRARRTLPALPSLQGPVPRCPRPPLKRSVPDSHPRRVRNE